MQPSSVPPPWTPSIALADGAPGGLLVNIISILPHGDQGNKRSADFDIVRAKAAHKLKIFMTHKRHLLVRL